MEAELRRGERGNVQTQTSFRDSDSSFEYESDRVSLHSVLHRLSSLFHTYLGGGSRTGGEGSAGSRRESPSPSQSAAVSRQSSTRHRQTNSTFLDVLVPSRRSSIWSLSTMVVAAQVRVFFRSASCRPDPPCNTAGPYVRLLTFRSIFATHGTRSCRANYRHGHKCVR